MKISRIARLTRFRSNYEPMKIDLTGPMLTDAERPDNETREPVWGSPSQDSVSTALDQAIGSAAERDHDVQLSVREAFEVFRKNRESV